MRIELTDSFHTHMQRCYPNLKVAEECVEEIMGVTLEQMRGKDRRRYISMARCIFSNLTHEEITPTYHLASYLNRDHGTLIWFRRQYDNMVEFDKGFKGISEKVTKLFNEKIKDGIF